MFGEVVNIVVLPPYSAQVACVGSIPISDNFSWDPQIIDWTWLSENEMRHCSFGYYFNNTLYSVYTGQIDRLVTD